MNLIASSCLFIPIYLKVVSASKAPPYSLTVLMPEIFGQFSLNLICAYIIIAA